MQIINETQYDFNDVLIKPKRSELTSRKDVNLVREFKGRWNKKIKFSTIPLILSNMDSITSTEMCRKMLENNCMVAHNKFITYEEWEELLEENLFKTSLKECRLAYTIGIRKNENGKYVELEQFRKLKNKYPDIFKHLIVDVPNGYTETFADFVEMVRKEFKDLFITAGNVCDAPTCQELLNAGCDVIKGGIGSGNCCQTRTKAGVGRPQLSTNIECGDICHQMGGYYISDGGCSIPADVCKALVGNSDIVMLGSYFAGATECEGEVVTKFIQPDFNYDGTPIIKEVKYKRFWGMSSKHAMEKHYGKMEKYRASEGREILAPCKGSVQDIINDLLGSIRSMMTYIGAKEIKDVSKRGTFYLVHNQVSNMFNDKSS